MMRARYTHFVAVNYWIDEQSNPVIQTGGVTGSRSVVPGSRSRGGRGVSARASTVMLVDQPE